MRHIPLYSRFKADFNSLTRSRNSATAAAAAIGRTRKGKLTEISPAPRKQEQEDASQ
jgi:hypothetical protein